MTTALVTGVSSTSVGGQIVKCLQLNNDDFRIIACSNNYSAMLEVVSDYHELLPTAGMPDYLGSLIALIQKYDVRYLIPGTEAELLYLLKRVDAITEVNCEILANSLAVVETCLDKSAFANQMQSIGQEVPHEVKVIAEDNDTSNVIAESIDYPIVLKPRLSSGGSKDVYIVQNRLELEFYLTFFKKNKIACTAQQYVGNYNDEYTIGVLSNKAQQIVSCSIMKRDLNHPLSIRSKVKNKTTRHDLGEWLCVSSGISQGVFLDDSNILQQSIDIAQSLNSMGPLNIQARLVNGRLITFEINPRFSGTSYFRALAGINEVNLLINYKQHYDGSVLVPRGGKCRRIITEMYSPE